MDIRKNQVYRLKLLVRLNALAGQSGFTIAEILIAIFIFSVIVTTVFGSYRATSEQVEIVSQNRQLVEMGRSCLDRMTHDLTALWVAQSPEYTPPGFNSDPDPYRIVGFQEPIGDQEFARLRFTSFEHLSIRPSRPFGIARIVYYVQRDDNDLPQLYRADHLYPYEPFEKDSTDPVLCAHVRSFDMIFYDDAGDSYDTWDSESESVDFSTPAAIGIRLEIGNEENMQMFNTRVIPSVRRTAVERKGP